MEKQDKETLTRLWNNNELKNCYCVLFSKRLGTRIVWNDEEGNPVTMKIKDVLNRYCFEVLKTCQTEQQAKYFITANL